MDYEANVTSGSVPKGNDTMMHNQVWQGETREGALMVNCVLLLG
jgi:hypothetical protein